jgi:hypothetical protein
MLTNRNDPGPGAKLDRELRMNPALKLIIDVFQSAPEPFQLTEEGEGLEIVPLDAACSARSRCRMKLFKPREEKERLCAFFFKQSNLSWSRDRFSYGGVEFLPDRLTEVDAREWLVWLVSGFDPERRPERLRRAFLYDIPE